MTGSNKENNKMNKIPNLPTVPSALIAYSPADTDALAKSGLCCTLVRLRK